MSKNDADYLEGMQKKLKCKLGNCGEHFIFEISENTLKYLEEKKQVYIGKCGKCHTVIKIKANVMNQFNRTMGKGNVVVLKSSFVDLFDEK